MKIRVKAKDIQLNVKVKLPGDILLDGQEMNNLARSMFRGFMKPSLEKHNVILYTGPVGIPLSDRLKQPVTRYEFYFIVEQVVDAAHSLQKGGFSWNKVLWDLKYAFINEATKEVRFLYLPYADVRQGKGNIMEFVRSILYSAIPANEPDMAYLSRFAGLLDGQDGFNPDKIEEFIKKEERSVVHTLKNHRANSSGYMTDKRDDYYRHYEQQNGEDEATGLLNEDEATGLLEEGTALLEEDDQATGLLNEPQAHYPTLTRIQTNDSFPVNQPVFRIGKDHSADYCVTDNNTISRSHASIVTRGARYFVIDLNSKNKTYLNGEQLTPQYETEIYDGDLLKLSNEEFIFRI